MQPLANNYASNSDKPSSAHVASDRELKRRCLQNAFTLLFLLLLCSQNALAQQMFPSSLDGQPDHRLEIFAQLEPRDHPGFGHWVESLGDINGDGYDDVAISTLLDTTFIYYGGSPFDHEPDLFVLGGAEGICAADFNGDGKTDIATSISYVAYPVAATDGMIRVYLHHGEGVPYDANAPNRVLLGETALQYGWSRRTNKSGVFDADINGDGASELLFHANTGGNSGRTGHQIMMILGGEDFLTQSETGFTVFPKSKYNSYADTYQVGDFNGDGCDDLIIPGSYVDTVVNERRYYGDVYFGNPEAHFPAPDLVIGLSGGWMYDEGGSDAADITGDGFCDLLDATRDNPFSAVHMFRGSARIDSIYDNDSIPSQDHDRYYWARGIYPMGDMTGDGLNDVVIAWPSVFIPYGMIYLVYAAGNGEHWRTATGFIGIHEFNQYMNTGAFPAGDLDGDGYHEMAIRGEPGSIKPDSKSQHVWFYSGDPRMSTDIDSPPRPLHCALDVYPQPLTAGSPLNLNVQLEHYFSGEINLTDLLGRTIYTREMTLDPGSHTISLPTLALQPGTYLLQLRNSRSIYFSSHICVI